MLKHTVLKDDKSLNGEITLAPSKSISSRMIIIQAIRRSGLDQSKLDGSEDVNVIDPSVREGETDLTTGNTGKALRFLKAFFGKNKGVWLITGSEWQRKRPVGEVVEILRKSGVNIKYVERTGFPPLRIIGKGLKGKISRIEASISSQVISASLFIAQKETPTSIEELKQQVFASSYIGITLRWLKYMGVNAAWENDESLIQHEYKDGSEMAIEADWSCASYWYEMVALAEKANITLNGLSEESIQSDAVVKELFEELGVKSRFTANGLILTKTKRKISQFDHDLSNNPDLIPTFAATCAMLKIPFRIKGVNSLRLKVNDRVESLLKVLKKLGVGASVELDGEVEILCSNGELSLPKEQTFCIPTFDDHRIALAFAPYSIVLDSVRVENPSVVSKVYPSFWDDCKKLGFVIESTYETCA